MGEQIKQELGFDASQALQALSSLDKMMGSFEKRIGQSVSALGGFNKQGGKTISMLKLMATEGNKAASALAKVAALKGQVGGTAAPGVGLPAGPPPNVDAYIQALEKLNKISETATTAQKRAYRSAITSAAEYAAKNKKSISSVIQQNANLEKSYVGTSNTMANRLAKMSSAAKKSLNEAGQATRKLSVDFQTMIRIVTTQAIVRALSQLRNVIRGAVSDAVEFQVRIAEIGTIAPVGELSDLAARVREISDEFNTPLDTTAKGYYQTISNQIGQTTDDFDTFVEAAARFSKTSVTDLASAVNLGSGALNAYGKSASEAESVFAKFFVTIKQGRLIGSELAQGLGTVSPIASQLGVELEEVNAALATITIQGISADKAFTQLRGVFNSFIKPTDEMSEAMKELGFANSEQIFQAHDLQAALRLVIGTTDGSAEAVSKLIPRIRGLTGGLALAGDESEHFTETMRLQNEEATKLFQRGFKLIIETDAEKATKEMNKLKNYMTQEFGDAILKASNQLLNMVSGADGLRNVMDAIGSQLPHIVLGVTALGTALAVMSLKARLAAGTLGGLTGPLLGVLAAAAAISGAFIGKQIIKGYNDEYLAFKEVMDKELQARLNKNAAELDSEKQKGKAMDALLAQGLASARKEYFKITDAAVEANKSILDDIKFFTSGIISEAQRGAQAAKSAVESLGKNVLASEQRVGKLRTSLDDRLFSKRLQNQSEIQKVFALTEKSGDLASRAAQKLSRATTEDQRASAEEEFRRANAFAEQALSIAEGTENRVLEQKALEAVESLTRKNIASEKAYQQTLASSQQVLAKRAKTEEKRVVELKKKQVELLDAYTLYDKKTGELLGADERADKLKGAQKTLSEFIRLSTKDKPLDVGAMLNFANLSSRMAAEMDVFRINEIIVSAEALNSLHKQLQDAAGKLALGAPGAGDLQALTGIEITGIKSHAEATAALAAERDKLHTIMLRYTDASSKVITAEKTLDQSMVSIQDGIRDTIPGYEVMGRGLLRLTGGLTAQDKVVTEYTNALLLMKQAAGGGAVTLEEFNSVVKKLIATEPDQPFLSKVITGGTKARITDAMNATYGLIRAQQELEDIKLDLPEGTKSIKEVQQRLEEIGASKGLEKPKQDAAAMEGSVTMAATAMSVAVSPAAQLASHWSSIALSAQLAASASSQIATPAMVAHGGPIRYLASGGFARGTDKIPAMLSEGERVMDAKSSRRFASQLSAIGAGVQPVYRESGGTVTNIGDVAINVTESKSAQATAREIMSAFRRETRRGSGRL